ncbi:MAG TPA: hypothetical protein VLB75_12010 [Steroidobacteraceae bacterium]|nr:hypothetical protein [Steroidobacteraceae bacterium]
MKRTKITTITRYAAFSLLAGFGLCALAQAQEEQRPQSFIYATYFQCDVTKQERADEIFKQLDQPFWETAVDDGTITGFGYMAHHTGGKWRRVQYYRAPTIEALLAAQDKIGDAIDAKNKKLSTEFGQICNSHDDYIWQAVTGKNSEKPRGKAAFSVYYECEINHEEEADALVNVVLAPVLDKLVTDGKLISWAWNEHIVGAQYRRLATMTASDVNALLQARGAVVEAIDKNPLSRTLDGICTSHADYIWEIKAEKFK